MLLTILSTAGIALFAGSGALVGVRKGFDLWGIVTVGVLTGVGGGILRDLLVGITPPTSLVNWLPISTAVIASLAVFKFHPSLAEIGRPVEILDALGVGLFASVGASIAVDVGANAFTATLVGLLTAIGGGIIRDVLVNDVPLLLQPSELYAIPALIGAAIVAGGMVHTNLPQQVWLIVGTVVSSALRLASLFRGWRLPTAGRGVRLVPRWRPGGRPRRPE
ncbi:trimeric intracellular cation channel family protein [Gordonia sp. NPDC003425]